MQVDMYHLNASTLEQPHPQVVVVVVFALKTIKYNVDWVSISYSLPLLLYGLCRLWCRFRDRCSSSRKPERHFLL